MNLKGRRIHIIGSASKESDESLLNYTHALVGELVTVLAKEGANFTIPFGKEPLLKNRTDGPSVIFDWTVAGTLHDLLQKGTIQPSGPNGALVTTVGTNKSGQTNQNIPTHRQSLYEELQRAGAIRSEFLAAGWTAGALQRQSLARMGDIMIGISGGQGVEHSAIEYSIHGKPVIPLDINLGASSDDGSGGAAKLFGNALTNPADFFSVSATASASDLLIQTSANSGNKNQTKVVEAIMKLLHALTPPQVFYVRLMNSAIAEFTRVEQFFRQTVDKAVTELGFEPYQVDVAKVTRAWINQAIFDSLHHSAVVIADITGMRPNCFVELGYAFGNGQKVILTAHKDTKSPFDISPIGTFIWDETEKASDQLARFNEHWERNINMPRLVTPRLAR